MTVESSSDAFKIKLSSVLLTLNPLNLVCEGPLFVHRPVAFTARTSGFAIPSGNREADAFALSRVF